MRVIVVYNPASGSALPEAELRRRFESAGIIPEAFLDVTKGLENQLKQWCEQEGMVVAAVGGDGTVSNVANYIVHTPAILAPLPGGTLNHFTKDLAIPQDLDQALANLAKMEQRSVDIASINGKIFLNNSSIGLYPSTLRIRQQLERDKLGKWPAAILAAFVALVRFRLYTVTIGAQTFQTPFVFVGNNDYHLENLAASGRSRLDEGILSVYTVESARRWSLVRLLLAAVAGLPMPSDELKVWKTTDITIHTKRPRVRVSYDGELSKLETPLRYEAHPHRLTVIGNS